VKERKAIVDGLRSLADESPNADVKTLAGHRGWYRVRLGDWRMLYFSDPPGVLVERIVSRRDLERALSTLT
jgi:mRNA-degrading endonuclease RelE of RelBE toxin-antitoxin system